MVRVICIGGSTTVAGRTNDETYPALLQKKLRARFPGLSLEVLNLGVSSATTAYWYARLPRVFGYQPDVVVQYPGGNDISWRSLPHFANDHPGRGRYYKSLLVQRLFPFPVEELDPYLEETFTTLRHTHPSPSHELLAAPAVFIDVCHLTPEGIDRLAEAFLPEVAELVRDTPGYRRWA